MNLIFLYINIFFKILHLMGMEWDFLNLDFLIINFIQLCDIEEPWIIQLKHYILKLLTDNDKDLINITSQNSFNISESDSSLDEETPIWKTKEFWGCVILIIGVIVLVIIVLGDNGGGETGNGSNQIPVEEIKSTYIPPINEAPVEEIKSTYIPPINQTYSIHNNDFGDIQISEDGGIMKDIPTELSDDFDFSSDPEPFELDLGVYGVWTDEDFSRPFEDDMDA
jgi:hypothetical protein